MPRLPMIRVIGSHDISTSELLAKAVQDSECCSPGGGCSGRGCTCPTGRSGSRFMDARVNCRSDRTARPYTLTAAVDIRAPGGSSMNGTILSGKPGIVQPMQTPPTLGTPPIPVIQPRLGPLPWTTGPQQPSFTMHD